MNSSYFDPVPAPDLFARVLAAVIADARANVLVDHVGTSTLRTARRNGALCGLKACENATPDGLFRIVSNPSVAVCENAGVKNGKPNATYAVFAVAECERSVIWVCECMSAFWIFQGERPILGDVHPNAVVTVYNITKDIKK